MTDGYKFLLQGLNQKPVAYYPVYTQITSSLVGGVMLSQLMYWFGCTGQDKIYKTNRDFSNELHLTPESVKTGKAKIKELPFMEVTREGAPAKTYYEIDWSLYAETLENFLRKEEDLYLNPKEHIHKESAAPRRRRRSPSITEEITEATSLLSSKLKVKVSPDDKPYFDFSVKYINKTIEQRTHLLNSTQVTSNFITNCVDEVRKVVTIDKISLDDLELLLQWAWKHSFWSDKIHRLTLLRKKGKNQLTRIGNIKAQYDSDSTKSGGTGFSSTYKTDISDLYKKDIAEGYSEIEAGKRRVIRKRLKKEGKDYVIIE